MKNWKSLFLLPSMLPLGMLQNVGIKGNGHLMNVELNSDEIAQFLIDWLASYGL